LYTDDSKIYRSIWTEDDQQQLQPVIDLVKKWSDEWLLKLTNIEDIVVLKHTLEKFGVYDHWDTHALYDNRNLWRSNIVLVATEMITLGDSGFFHNALLSFQILHLWGVPVDCAKILKISEKSESVCVPISAEEGPSWLESGMHLAGFDRPG